jgi:hypothetical protein
MCPDTSLCTHTRKDEANAGARLIAAQIEDTNIVKGSLWHGHRDHPL